MEITSGSLPRIRIKIDGRASQVNLRKHQRFVVRGILNLAPAGCQFSYRQQTDHEMDISEGGIGLNLPTSALENPERREAPDIREEGKVTAEQDTAVADETGSTAPMVFTSEPQDGANVEVNATGQGIILTPSEHLAQQALKVRLELTVYAESSGRIDSDQPSLNINCHAEVRRKTKIEGTKDEFVGMQFIDMAVEQQETLRLWLATHSVKLRNR